jgi:hypothetical protein
MNIPSMWRIANIDRKHVMILAPEANPAWIEFSEMTPPSTYSNVV